MSKLYLLNKFRLFLLGLSILILTACSEAPNTSTVTPSVTPGITLLEKLSAEEDGALIPYSKYQLDNGLTLIIHEDNSDPLVHVDVTFHVGSAREEAQRSGFAHFFEHMLFQGSNNVPEDLHAKLVNEAGGSLNGSTSSDRTNYFETVPSNQLETMLWLESDRMGFFLDSVTQEKFEIQRDTVKNERNQRVENSPYGLFGEVNSAALYPPEHPYSWPVIGYPQDLDAATLDDLKAFFLRWYGPNNATLTIGGNLDEQNVIDLVIKYFGEIPTGPEVLPDAWEMETLNADRYVSYIDNNIRFPALMFTFPTVSFTHPDYIALSALNNIITIGRKSFFYKEFILTSKAIQASGFNNAMELGGSLTFLVLPYPGTSLSQFETEMRAVFNSFDESSISDEDIQIFKAQQEASLIDSLASVRGKVSQLASNQTFIGNPNYIENELSAIQNLTKADVLRVFSTYVKDKYAVIQSVIPPSDPNSQTQPDNYTIPARLARQESANNQLEARQAISSFDRTVQPIAGPSPLVVMPNYWEQTLDNGISLIGTHSDEVPLVNLRLVFEGGHLLEDPAQYGLASLTASMMNEGTTGLSPEEFEVELQKLGSRISVGSGNETTVINVQTLLRNLDPTLALLEQRLFETDFTEEDLQRIKQQYIESLLSDIEEPSGIASAAYPRLLYGADHAFSVSSDGKPATLQGITLEDVQNFSRQSLVSQVLNITVVGDISQQEIITKLDFLQKLPDETISPRQQPVPPVVTGNTLYLIDKPGAAQSEIRIGYMGTTLYDPTGTYFEQFLMNYPLGRASLSNRIILNLREDKGYTYGASSRFSATKLPGPFTAAASVRADATADSVVQFINEITQYRDQGITPEELEFTKAAIGQSEALDYETPSQKAGLLERIIRYSLSSDFAIKQQEIINNITKESIDAIAREYLPVERMTILVVGDKALIEPSLIALGYEIVELDTEANPL